MMRQKRRQGLLKLLAKHQQASVEELGGMLHSSICTVRRDIAWLEEHKLLRRVRGGAAHLPTEQRAFGDGGPTFEENIDAAGAQKRAIARHAAAMCGHSGSIIINGGTTTYMMAEFLTDTRLKILTNSFPMAARLSRSSENEVSLTGGKVYREQNVVLSPFENLVSQHHYAARMFLGVHGISARGLLEDDPLLIRAEAQLISQAEELIVLADSSKFASKAGLILCALDRVRCVITDTGAPEEAVRSLELAGVEVVMVEPESTPQWGSLRC
ncbi:MAG TPA: DeoR/GlpR family DNA-binding transcription regulator [Duganella sp.]|nr:DeoR/GlpR family DNA-binding transcription regulator [Duganella sp.]